MKKITLSFLLMKMLLSLKIVSAQSTPASIRGLYVNDISHWLGDTAKENRLLRYSQLNNFNYLTIYGLHNLSWTTSSNNQLAAFILKAKQNYGIKEVGAAGESYSSFKNKIVPYNQSRLNSRERFDVCNLEFEFWITSRVMNVYNQQYLIPNGLSSDTAGAFDFAISQFRKIDSLCAANNMISEIYLGWPTKGQMQQIATIADRILLHAYRPDDNDVYQYSRNRLADIASIPKQTVVIPIFSSEPDYMEHYLSTHTVDMPYQVYQNHYAADSGNIANRIVLGGYQWFAYYNMPVSTPTLASISANGPVNFCPGGQVTLTSSPGVAYLWSPGGQTTSSISVSTSGNYSVRVTTSSGNVHYSAPVIVNSQSSPQAPVITADAPLRVCSGRSVTLTSSPGSSYLWSNGETTRSISVNASGLYSVTVGSGNCSATSTAAAVSVVSPPPAPTIASGSSLINCPGDVVVLTSSHANGYRWSTGDTTRSIAAASAGAHWVLAYSAPYCSTLSSIVTISKLPEPQIPVVQVIGNTTLDSTNSYVVLRSSTSNSYQWSSGQSSREIMVHSQGSFRVTTTNSDGCTATSADVVVSANGCVPPPMPTISVSGPTVLQSGDSVILTSSSAGGYLWSNGQTTRSITVFQAGNYTVRTYNAGYCFSTSMPQSVVVVSVRGRGIADVTKVEIPNNSYSAFFNASESTLYLSGQSETKDDYQLLVSDLLGKEILTQQITLEEGHNKIPFHLSNLRPGIYVAVFYNSNEKFSLKFLVN